MLSCIPASRILRLINGFTGDVYFVCPSLDAVFNCVHPDPFDEPLVVAEDPTAKSKGL